MTTVVTRESWPEQAARAGLRLEDLASLTGKSYAIVYRYKHGTRRAPDAWIEAVAAILRERTA